MNPQKLWTKDFLIISITNLFVYISFYLLIATITVFAEDRFQASPSEAGLASGIFVIGTLIARLFSGKFIEQVGRQKMLYMGLLCLLITNLFYFAAVNMMLLLFIRFLNGAALGVAGTATSTIVAHIIPEERRGEGIGYYSLSVTMAAAFGPFLGIFINLHVGFNMNFILCAFLVAISFIGAFFLRIPKAQTPKGSAAKVHAFTWSSFFEPNALPIAIISLFVGLSYSSILSFLSSYSIALQIADTASFFFIVYAAAILVSRPFTGRLFDLKGENVVMVPALLVFALGLFLLSQTHAGITLLAAGALVGFGYGTFSSSAQAIAIKSSPPHRLGLATSTYFIFLDGGIGIGPFLLGLLIPLLGYSGLYQAMSIVAVACLFLYYFLHGRTAHVDGDGRL